MKPVLYHRLALTLSALMPLLLLSACDTMTDEVTTHEAGATAIADDAEVWTYDNGSTVRVVADPHYSPERHSFESLDAYHRFLEELDAASSITVNAELWERLRHANDPAEVAVLDATGTVEVAGYLYEVGPEAIYKTRLDERGAERELEFYYGLTGDEDLREFERAVLALTGTPVDDTELRNPFAKELVREARATDIGSLTAHTAPEPSTQLSASGNCTSWSASDSRDFATCEVRNTYIPYNMSGFLPAGYQTGSGDYNTRIWMINQSYRKGFKKKAYGATQVQVRRLYSNDPYFGLGEVCPVIQRYDGQIRYYDLFEVEVRVEGDSSGRSGCIASERTGRSGGAQSYHSAWTFFVDAVNGPGSEAEGYYNRLNNHYVQ